METISPSSAGSFVGKSIFFYIRLGLMSLFIVYLFVHAIFLGIKYKDVSIVITEIGSEFLKPVEKASEISDYILSGNAKMKDYWYLYYNLFIIYLWLKLLVYLWGWTPISNESNKFNNLLLAFISFLIIQIFAILISLINNGDKDFTRINLVWQSWIKIGKALMYLFTQQKINLNLEEIMSKYRLNNTCVDKICNY